MQAPACPFPIPISAWALLIVQVLSALLSAQSNKADFFFFKTPARARKEASRELGRPTRTRTSRTAAPEPRPFPEMNTTSSKKCGEKPVLTDWLARAIVDLWLSPADSPVITRGRKTVEEGQVLLGALGLREEAIHIQFTGSGLLEN